MSQFYNQTLQEHLTGAQRRLEALDKMEVKLKAMRALAVYAASRTLSQAEVVRLQEWMNILQAEVNALDNATTCTGEDDLVH